MTLENSYNWEQLAEKFANQIEKVKPKDYNRKHFINWFMDRQEVGLRFDWQLVYRCYKICRKLEKQGDSFTVVVGKEGVGKTTLGLQLAAWTSPTTFSLENVAYNSHDYLNLLRDIAADKANNVKVEKKTILLDEAALDLFSREAMSLSNRWLSKAFFTQRFLNVHVILCIPNFFLLDTVVRQHRVDTLLSITSRGHYKAITGRGLHTVNAQASKCQRQINLIQIPDGWFWTGNTNKPFPNTVNQEEYESHKLKNIQKFLATAQEESMGVKMIPSSKVAKELGIDGKTMINYIKSGEVEGKQLGPRWFITKDAYNKILDTKNTDFTPLPAPNTINIK